MLDIFGVHREIETKTAGETGDPPAIGGSVAKAWWALFLLLDTACLCAFGGATVALWMHRQNATVSAPPPRTQRALPKSRTNSLPPTPAPTPQEPAKPPEPAKTQEPPAAKQSMPLRSADRAATKGPIGSPGVVATPDLPRRQTHAAGSSSASEPKQAPAAPITGRKQKAIPVEFACQAPASTKQVFLKGPFLVRSQGVKSMIAQSDGTWRLTISLLPGTYKYRCVVDGRKSKPISMEVR